MSKPTIVFVHGAWHDSSVWDAIRPKLSAQGYENVAVSLVSPGSQPAVTSHLEDVAVVRKQLEKLIVEAGKEVVLVMHSYGGLAGAGAVQGLEQKERKERGESGGVVAALFIAAFLVSKGLSLLGQFPQRPPYLIDDPNREGFCLVDDFHNTFYNDVSKGESDIWLNKMRSQPAATFLSPVESTCWESGNVACTYLLCEKDQGVFPFLQELMLEHRKADSPKPWKIIKADASHSVWLSQPDTVIKTIIDVCDGN